MVGGVQPLLVNLDSTLYQSHIPRQFDANIHIAASGKLEIHFDEGGPVIPRVLADVLDIWYRPDSPTLEVSGVLRSKNLASHM